MPWNDNANPGPWGTPPSGDDGERKSDPPRRPSGGGRGPNRPGGPDLGAGLERLRQRMGGAMGGGGGGAFTVRPGVFAVIGGAMVALWMASGFYQVQPNEVGVVSTFGAYSRSEPPGLHYRLPSPIESVDRVPVTTSNRTIIGGGGTAETDVPQESLMLTSDENIVDVNFSVFWKVSDASRYLFSTRKPEDAVKAVAESAMREVVGKTPADPILTKGRGDVQRQVVDLMQKTLDSWGAGITISDVQISTVNPPQEVNAAFRDVQSAEQDRDSAVNVANGYRNKVVQEAKGSGQAIIQQAQAYKEQAVREATGDTSRFNAIYNEYRRAPEATRERLYLETMERVLGNSNKVIVSGKGLTAPVILPPDVFRPRGAAAAPPPAAAVPQAPAQAQPQAGAQQ